MPILRDKDKSQSYTYHRYMSFKTLIFINKWKFFFDVLTKSITAIQNSIKSKSKICSQKYTFTKLFNLNTTKKNTRIKKLKRNT